MVLASPPPIPTSHLHLSTASIPSSTRFYTFYTAQTHPLSKHTLIYTLYTFYTANPSLHLSTSTRPSSPIYTFYTANPSLHISTSTRPSSPISTSPRLKHHSSTHNSHFFSYRAIRYPRAHSPPCRTHCRHPLLSGLRRFCLRHFYPLFTGVSTTYRHNIMREQTAASPAVDFSFAFNQKNYSTFQP